MFLHEEVPYLGHVVTRDGTKPDPAKTDVSQVHQFLGLMSYYRRFISGFFEDCSTALLKDAPSGLRNVK